MLCFYPMAGFGVAEIFFNISNPFVFIPFYFLVYLYFMGCIQSWINDFKDLYASAVIYIFISVPILWIFFGMTSGIGWYLTILWFINILIFMLLPKSSSDSSSSSDSNDDLFWALFLVTAVPAFPPFLLLWLFKKD